MNFALWIAAGAAAGWIGFAVMGLNAVRGMPASIVVGVLAAVAGGELVAPMLSPVAVNPGEFNPLSLVTAFAFAAGGLVIIDMAWRRFSSDAGAGLAIRKGPKQ